MKKTLLVLILILSMNNAFAQNNNNKASFAFALENSSNTSRADLIIKPDYPIKILTLDRRIIKSSDYFLIKDSIGTSASNSNPKRFIVMNTQDQDTVALSDIVWIKCRVLKDEGRKILGGVVTAVSIPLMFGTFYLAALGGAGAVFPLIGNVGITAKGISLMGAHKYKTESGWKIKEINVYPN